ncbi:MAG: hypothetical protein WCO45_00185 [Pseudanabaena sp. ELA607]|jgi:hypothetical protein
MIAVPVAVSVLLPQFVQPESVTAGTITQSFDEASQGWSFNFDGNFSSPRYNAARINGNSLRLWINSDNTSNIPSDPRVPSGESFKGVVYFFREFSFPEKFSDAKLNITIGADDQVTADLNGHVLGSRKLFDRETNVPVQGAMTDGNFQQKPTTFISNFTPLSFDDSSKFQAGRNILRFLFNNTFDGSNPFAPVRPMTIPGDQSALHANGSISYNVPNKPVPLPGLLPGIAVAFLFGVKRIVNRSSQKATKTAL